MTQQHTTQQGAVDHVRQFYQRVKSMRNAQKMYFKHRELNWLNESKRLESEVDDMLRHAEKGGQL